MFWAKFCGIARAAMAAVLIVAPATVVTAAPAYADCGDPGQPPCTGAVPTVDEVAGLLNQLTDTGTPDPQKASLVAGGLSQDELSELDDHANWFGAHGYLPLGFVVTDIQPAPNNYAGATVFTPKPWPGTATKPLVLVEQGGHWLLTHDTTMTLLGRVWSNAHRRVNPFLL